MNPNKPAISLQSKLIKTSVMSSVIAGLCALVILLGMSLYQTMQIQDEIMDEISDMLLASDLSSRSAQSSDELSEQFDIQYQLKLGELILTESKDYNLNEATIADAFLKHQQFAFVWRDGEIIRVYSAQKEDLALELYQPLSVRFDEISETLLSLIAILLLLWIIQWLILHFAVKKQFRSLKELSDHIAQKSAQDLSKITQHSPELKELQPIVLQLNRMLDRLEKSLVAEQRFTSDASHELRSPLSAIQMRLQLLKRKYSNDDIADDLKQIEVDISRGSNVLNNLLMLARLDPTQSETLAMQEFELSQLIADVQYSLELFALEKQISLQFEPQQMFIYANQELIYTCIRNLMDNAIRYAPTHTEISIRLNQTEQSTEFSILNTGEVVSDEVIKRMGERFYRELGTKTQGSGLGLSICKKIIDLHNGKLIFLNPEQGGLIVKFIIPRVGNRN